MSDYFCNVALETELSMGQIQEGFVVKQPWVAVPHYVTLLEETHMLSSATSQLQQITTTTTKLDHEYKKKKNSLTFNF
jgi:hypothetical protein